MRTRTRAVVVPVAVSLLAAALWLSQALTQGEDALIARRYQEAVGHLTAALKEEPAERQDRVLLLLARAQFLAGDVDSAIATYERLGRDHPDSRLVDKAALQRAETLAAQKRFMEAAAVYREQIERLTGPERKEQVAETYLGLADKALGSDNPDPRRAVTFYDLAVDLGLGDARARAVRLLAAEAILKAGEAGDAIRRLEPLVNELDAAGGKLRAMLTLGRARLLGGDAPGARGVLRDLIALAPETAEAGDAAYEVARTFGVPEPGAAQLDRAIAALRSFAERYPAHTTAQVAEFLVARCYLSVGRSEEGLAALRAFLDRFGDQPLDEVPTARATVGFVLFAQGRIDEAIEAWRVYLKAHPAHGDWERVQRAIVDAELARADRAEEDERWSDERELLEQFGRDHPLDERNPAVFHRIGETFAAEKKWDDARAAFERCVRKYPGRDESSRAQFRIGEVFESETFDYQRALDAYRAVTWGASQGEARARIARLERKALHLRTERTFRTGEAASLVVTSRNVPDLRVRIYKLDLETWFRATHLPGSVERLDIEVIEPDRTFQSPVPEYVPFRETERTVPVGFDAPGAYVVKVDDQELEATTMVLVTDLGLIVKTSRQELFAFTQDLKQDRVRGGVRVVVSDGQKVLTEGLTDDRGAFRWRDPALRNLAELRVFAVDAGGSGAGTLDLSGLGYGEGLAAKGYLFTDRPAYRPGDFVHLKGIVRDVKDGLYVLPNDATPARLSILSPSGRALLDRTVEYTAFGSFAADLALPGEAETGTWRVVLARGPEGRATSSATFEVARFELPRLLVTAEPKHKVVFRGEPVEGRVLLRHFYGEPAVGKDVRVVMMRPDGTVAEAAAKTNAEGAVDFSFETTEFAEEAVAVVQATVAEEGVSTSLAVPVVTTEFTPSVALVRDVQIAGQPFEVTVKVEDRTGAPLARSAEVVLLRREVRKRGVAEVEVQRREIRTSGEDGAARVTLVAPKGGAHVVRVRAKDRFDQLVTGERAIVVSGEDDAIKLRILSDRQQAKVGETLDVRIVNRAEERLALRTLQADGVLEYAAVRVPKGESTFRIALEGRHAPNFALALAMIDGTELRTAEQDFVVARDLAIELRAERVVAAPGDEVALELVARDPAGRPVAAEVALALVDRSLFELYEDGTPHIGAFFWGAMRETTFKTVSSCSWSYDGPSRPVSEALVAEERRALEETERVVRDALDARNDGRPASDPRGGAVVTDRDQFFVGAGRNAGPGGPATPGPAGPATGGPAGPVAGGGGGQLRFATPTLNTAAQQDQQVELGQQLAGQLFKSHAAQVQEVDVLAGFAMTDVHLGELLQRAADQPRNLFATDGAWLSSVTTGADGRAELKLRMPAASGEWRLTARGVTVATDVGDAETALRTAEDLVASIASPATLVVGDRTTARADLHNRTGEPFALAVATRVGDSEQRSELKLAAGEERAIPVEVRASTAGELTLGLVADGARKVSASDSITVLPFGVERRDGRAGVLTESARVTLSLPEGRAWRDLALRVDVRPGSARSLVAAALDAGLMPLNCRQVAQTNLALASRGLAALAVLDHLDRVGDAAQADRSALTARFDGAVASLVSAQREDGGVAWIGTGGGDVRTTAAALRLFQAAATRGSAEARRAADRAGDFLIGQMRGVRDEDRAEPERALAEAGRGRFEALNALHRRRAAFDLGTLGRLALAWRALGRPELAAEVDAVIAPKLTLPENADATVVTAVALAARSLVAGAPADPRAVRAVQWLDTERRGASWATPEATAEAVLTLARAGGVDVAAASEGSVTLVVNGGPPERIALGDPAARSVFDVPAERLRPTGNVVELRLEGRGKARYAALLSGFADGFEKADRRDELVGTERRYLPALLRVDGRVVEPGFAVVSGRYDSFTNTITQLPVGGSGRVEVRFFVRGEPATSYVTPVVVEEPIPAGCTVPRESVAGAFEHFDLLPDRLVFYYRDGVRSDTVRYELLGRFEGSYRALPTIVRGADRPDLVAYGPDAALEVVARGSATKDTYRSTPDELWALGKAAFEQADLEGAGRHLEALAAGWTLRDDVFREVARMMLFVAIQRSDARGVVRWFEELKDRYPDLVVPFDAIRAVGKAYIDLGEFEAAVLVFRATAEASFLKEANVATTLQQLGEVQASVRFLRRLLETYPDLNTMRQSLYGIGQRLGLIAAGMQDGARVDPRVGARDELRRQSVATFREFLVLYPEDPLAEEVSFAWATTLIEMAELARSLEVSEGALARYPGSSLEDEFLYTAGYARFVLGQPAEALVAVRRVATEEFGRSGGGRGPSENRKHAIYLEGQIHHALGQTALALAEYDRVAEDFSDAAEAAEFFRREELSLPEVTRVGTQEDGKLTITTRNLPAIAIKVYKVDLMRLYLLHKSLDNVRDIQLHGIAPLHDAEVKVDGSGDHEQREIAVPLPLSAEGAYLVVARAGEHLASGLVLRSDLQIDAQESLDVGRVRVNVEKAGKWVGAAHVKVVGSGDGRIRSGDTDLRGIFVADDVVGKATVIVRLGEGFAFYRGTGVHQPERVAAPPPQKQYRGPRQQQGQQEKSRGFDAWENNLMLNDSNRRRQNDWLEQQVLDQKSNGVQVLRTK